MEYLLNKKCKPCEGGTPPLGEEEASAYLSELDSGWSIEDNKTIQRKFKFKNFKEAMDFVNKVALLAEEQGHHPGFCVNYNKVSINLTTHAVKGLSENDFIIASKVGNIYGNKS